MFKRKNVYVNQNKKQPNYIAVMILSIIASISWTSNFYMFQDLQADYNRAITYYNTNIENRDREVGKDSEEATHEETASTVTSHSDEGVISPSTIVEMSAYTSRPQETDNSPCISADNTNICEYDGCVVASNDYEFGTIIDVEGFGFCEVKDRMNSRYTSTGNMDIYFGMDLDGALKFGRKHVNIKIVS